MAPNNLLDRLFALEPTLFAVISVYLNTQADQHGRDNFDAFVRRGLKTRAKRRAMRTMSHLHKLLNRLATVGAPA